MQLSFLSQDDSCPSECTPRDQNSLRRSSATIYSPEIRKKRGRFFAIFGKSNAESNCTEPSHFELSQDDSNQFPFSQFSQDFTERLGGLSMKASQDNFSQSCDARSALLQDGNSFPFGSNASSTMSCVNFKLNPPSTVKAPLNPRSRLNPTCDAPQIPSSSSKSNCPREVSTSSLRKGNVSENDCQKIVIPSPIENPFLIATENGNGIKKSKPKKKPNVTSIWIGPYQERPRYVTDFEHIKELGEGTFSTVFCARKRLDGMFYAVKRIKKKISSESEGRLVVKESCALASLMSCPYMIRYFGCWIDDGHLHIQTEYCDKGSLDCFVSNPNARTSDLLIPDDKNLNINGNDEDDDDIQINHDNDNDISNENENNDNNDYRNDINDDNRNMIESVDEIFTEKSSNTNLNEKQLFSVYENSQNDSLFDSQKDEMENNDEKELKEFQENTLEYNNNANNHYSNNNDDNDDELFIKEDDDDHHQNMDINIDGIDISKIVKNNEFCSDINKENNENNNNDNKILSVCENDAHLRYSDAIFSAEEDSRNSDTYSCFSESNSGNYYDLKYNNKNEEFQNENEVENSNYEDQILRNNKNNKETIIQEKRISKKNDNNTLQNKNNKNNEKKKVLGEVNRREEGNDNQGNEDRADMIEVEKERAREGEEERGRVRVGEGGQEEENRNADNEMPCGVVSEGLVWGILHSMGSALQYMHSRGMVHLDLRPANIFITQNTQYCMEENTNSAEKKTLSDLIFEGAYVLRLGDLGHACTYNETNWIEGESRYCSLELIVSDDGQPLDLRHADMFSLGASVYELCLGRELGSGESKEWHAIRDGILLDSFVSTYSPSLVRFIRMLLHPTPTLRPSAQETVTLASATLLTMRHQLSLENTTLKCLKVENEVERGAARTSTEQYLLPRPSSPVLMKSTPTTTSTSTAPGATEPCKMGPQSLLQKPAKRPFAHLFPADDTFMST